RVSVRARTLGARGAAAPRGRGARRPHMNYLSHGHAYLDDDPWILAGTSLPDWLAAADRRCRVREEQATALAAEGGRLGALARGVLAHLEDDRWFHAGP